MSIFVIQPEKYSNRKAFNFDASLIIVVNCLKWKTTVRHSISDNNWKQKTERHKLLSAWSWKNVSYL